MTEIFKRLRGKGKKTQPVARKSASVAEDTQPRLPLAAEQPSLPHLLVGCAQSTGMLRPHNEDALISLNLGLTGSECAPCGLFVVADGMGGHVHGEAASQAAVRAVGQSVVAQLFPGVLELEPPSAERMEEILRQAVVIAHEAVQKKAPGGGTTLTILLIYGFHMTLAHIGDSRAYYIQPDGQVEALTRDHSLVKRMVELGQLSEAEAATHPHRNVLYRAIGQGDPGEADMQTLPVPDRGYLLLCSDGLWGLVAEAELARLCLSQEDPQKACLDLLDAANAAGGPDNSTAILIKLPGT